MFDLYKVAAVKLRQKLEPIDPTEPIKPPSFAAETNNGESKPRYIIYEARDGRKDVVIDTAPSQANRIEPLFIGSGLIPEVTVEVDTKTVNIAELGHRSCDAAVRFSTGAQEITHALKAYQAGDAEPLAKLAPLDLLFGSWDSRDSRTKLTRLIRSVIRATDVSEPIQKLGQYRTSVSKEPFLEFRDKQLSEQGILDCPVSGTLDGVLVRGEMYRSAELNVRGIRRLRGESLQNYILGLGLFALTAPVALDLREGCNVIVIDTKTELVNEDGTRTEFKLTHEDAITFAQKAAKEFGVGQARHFVYDPKIAIEAIKAKKESGKGKQAKAVVAAA
jgi:CRISPR-associated protein Csb1